MKTTLTVLVVLFLVWLLYYRQRIYVRDPLATVYRDDVKQSGVEVFINYSNDVLLEQDSGPAPSRILLQDWNKMPGTPQTLTCVHWIACMTEADKAPTIPITWTGPAHPANTPAHRADKSGSPTSEPARWGDKSGDKSADKGKYDPKLFMTSRQVTFIDSDASTVRIELR
jgi:hypothetical protein